MFIMITTFLIQEKQLKKVRAKQKRLQAILGGEDIQRVEAEILAESDIDDGGQVMNFTHKLSYSTLLTDTYG